MRGKELGLVRDYMHRKFRSSRPVRCDGRSKGSDIKDAGDLRRLGPRMRTADTQALTSEKKLQYWNIAVITETRLEGFDERKVRKDEMDFDRKCTRGGT